MKTAREYVDPNPAFFGRRPVHCYVRPRYSAGSPAMVHDAVALQVARDEHEEYARILEGVYGEAQKRRAEALGLRGIAYAMAEKGSGRNFRWLVFDLVTGEYFRRYHDTEMERLGFQRFMELPEAVQRVICETGQRDDYERTFWKRERWDKWTRYEPELVRVD